jgi:hypothetical protein
MLTLYVRNRKTDRAIVIKEAKLTLKDIYVKGLDSSGTVRAGNLSSNHKNSRVS